MSSASTALVSLPSKVRSKITNDPSQRHGRSAEARRVRDLYVSYHAALGHPPDVGTQSLILDAAESVVIAERARADVIAGNGGDLTNVVRVEGMAARALRRIGLNKVATPAPLSLQDQLRARGYTPPANEPPDAEEPADETAISDAASTFSEVAV
jgi:hypothetical protein